MRACRPKPSGPDPETLARANKAEAEAAAARLRASKAEGELEAAQGQAKEAKAKAKEVQGQLKELQERHDVLQRQLEEAKLWVVSRVGLWTVPLLLYGLCAL